MPSALDAGGLSTRLCRNRDVMIGVGSLFRLMRPSQL
jgi:hypothetical protein